ncbi:hypothetical protein P8C59_009418 [Phyllachora maydis]|uniref:Uncharacterized protein n=1 Tax=Phyllachora maydis TaxID=1825666 RepID=A0AAD9ICL2_9PEZI|nr:hypothetical protein P8C59_009418 [Phyllachora maydis]
MVIFDVIAPASGNGLERIGTSGNFRSRRESTLSESCNLCLTCGMKFFLSRTTKLPVLRKSPVGADLET